MSFIPAAFAFPVRTQPKKHRSITTLACYGWKLGDYGSWGKMTNYEMDTRVPLIIKPADNIQGTGRRDQIVESLDIYPMLCDLAGLSKSDGLSEESFIGHFDDPGQAGILREGWTPWRSILARLFL